MLSKVLQNDLVIYNHNTWCSMSRIEEPFEGGGWVICNIP